MQPIQPIPNNQALPNQPNLIYSAMSCFFIGWNFKKKYPVLHHSIFFIRKIHKIFENHSHLFRLTTFQGVFEGVSISSWRKGDYIGHRPVSVCGGAFLRDTWYLEQY